MRRRATGGIALLLGLAIVGVAAYSWLTAGSMADLAAAAAAAQNLQFDSADWLKRWEISVAGLGMAGAVTALAGAILMSNRNWGFLALATVWAAVAASPWVFEARYAFERSSAVETLVATAISAGCFIAFRIGRRAS